jgi:hypothetical protein
MMLKYVQFVLKNGLILVNIDLFRPIVDTFLEKCSITFFFIFFLNKNIKFRCIEKWLRTTPNCPQCQSFAKRRDLRRIYCRSIQVLDTSERDNAIRERDLERKTRKKLEYEKAELQLAYDVLKEQCKYLQTEYDHLLKYIFSCQRLK